MLAGDSSLLVRNHSGIRARFARSRAESVEIPCASPLMSELDSETSSRRTPPTAISSASVAVSRSGRDPEWKMPRNRSVEGDWSRGHWTGDRRFRLSGGNRVGSSREASSVVVWPDRTNTMVASRLRSSLGRRRDLRDEPSPVLTIAAIRARRVESGPQRARASGSGFEFSGDPYQIGDVQARS